MNFEIPPNMSIKEALGKSNVRNCMRYTQYYVEVQKLPQDKVDEMGKRLFDAMMEPWESIRDESIPPDVLFVAKHVTWGSMERELGMLDPKGDAVSDFDKFLDIHKKVSESGRKLYDDIIEMSKISRVK